MQVTNCSNQNFKGLSFSPNALKSMSERIPAGKFISVQESLSKKYKNSPLDIVIDTTTQESIRLCAKIKQNTLNKIRKMIIPYIEEDCFSCIFCNPEKFFSKLCKKLDIDEKIILSK